MIQPNLTAGSVYLLAFLLTLCAAGLAHLLKRIRAINIPSGIMSPMGSIYALTAAFLLSNAFLNVSNLKTSITQEVVTINKLGAWFQPCLTCSESKRGDWYMTMAIQSQMTSP